MKQYGKRVLALLAAAMLCLSVTGCGSKDQSSGIGNETSGASSALASSSEEPLSVPDADAKKESDTASTLHANVLVVYFSYTGHLDSMAHWIADETGGDLVRVTAKDPYPDDYDETVDRAKREQDDDARPEINVELTAEEMAQYDTVFFGFPVWWYDLPMPMDTFLEAYDFSEKTVIPFFSHEGSSNGANSLSTLETLAAGATVQTEDALSIQGGKVDASEQDVRSWVQGLGYVK